MNRFLTVALAKKSLGLGLQVWEVALQMWLSCSCLFSAVCSWSFAIDSRRQGLKHPCVGDGWVGPLRAQRLHCLEGRTTSTKGRGTWPWSAEGTNLGEWSFHVKSTAYLSLFLGSPVFIHFHVLLLNACILCKVTDWEKFSMHILDE